MRRARLIGIGVAACFLGIGLGIAVFAQFNPPSGGGGSPPSGGGGGTTSQFDLTVTKSGVGTGTITSNPPIITCDASCATASVQVNAGETAVLTATPSDGSVFNGWSGDCSGAGSCSITINTNKTAQASFSVAISDGGGGGGGDNKDDSDPFFEFAEQVVAKKKSKKPKGGYSVFGKTAKPLRLLYQPNSKNPSMRVRIIADEPFAEVTFVGSGFFVKTATSFYTGNTTIDFNGRKDRWNASYYTKDNAQFAEVIDARSGVAYQEEVFTDAGEGLQRVALRASESLLAVGLSTGEFIIITDLGVAPAAPSKKLMPLFIPRIVFPTENFFELLNTLQIALRAIIAPPTYAARESLLAEKVKLLAPHRRLLTAVELKYAELANIDFENLTEEEFARAEKVLAQFNDLQNKIIAIEMGMGRLVLFNRLSWWQTADEIEGEVFAASGASQLAANLMKQMTGSFDAYVVPANEEGLVIAVRCVAQINLEDGMAEQSCAPQTVSSRQAAHVKKIMEAEGKQMETASVFLQALQEQLFGD